VACLAVGLALGLHASGVLAGLEDASVDQRMRLRPAKAPADVVVVGLDSRSLDLLGERPPIPRSLHARLLDRLRGFDPLVIGYDIQFTEETELAEDAALYEAVSRARPVVLVTAEVTEDGDTRVLGSTANVERAGGFVASSRFPLSRGGVYRRVEPRVAGLETFAFTAARAAGRRPAAGIGPDGLLIDYAGPPGTVETVSFADVLDGRVPGSTFRGKAVVVGVTAKSEGDVHRTPMASGDLMSGPEIQANALSTVMRGVPLRDGPGWLAAVLVAIYAVLGVAFASRLSPAWLAATTIATLGATAAASYAVLLQGVLVEVAAILVALLIGVCVGGVARHLRVRRSEREMRAALTRLAGGRDIDELLARVRDEELILLSEGASFGDYEIHRALGIGGMGVVHLARHVPSDRLVALKVLSARLIDRPDMRDRFIREAQAATALHHDAVVSVIEAGEVGDRPYIAMQFVEGGTLGEVARARSLTPTHAVGLLAPIADALDHAHACGIIHRDVKPSNVLVDGDGNAYLADFGIAHVLDATRMTTNFVGTPAYTAPEQINGEEPTGACDQYALGCVLFECLTGRLPFPDPTFAGVLRAHLVQPPPPASSFVPDLGAAIDDVLARAMAKQPADRYRSCAAFIAAAATAIGRPATPTGGSASTPTTADATTPAAGD
jgi:CHASE2 domain-containing sensor protein/predicted Ser/Thr protein kinase